MEPFVKKLIRDISVDAGCGAQYGGCPCNTCFHTWAIDELGLDSDIAHMFWIVVLALRGDYKQNDLFQDPNWYKKLVKRAKKLEG